MGFLFPLFLIAGLALAIPVLIHLFNLRKYKRIYFSDTRFLKEIQLSTRKQSKIRDWRILLSRLLFLTALILAFAQPFLSGRNDKHTAVDAIYIDNSYSMQTAKGQQTLMQQSIAKAKALIDANNGSTKFLILTNDHPSPTRPLIKSEALQYLNKIEATSKEATLNQIIQSVRSAQSNTPNEAWDLYIFSDLQKNTFVKDNKVAPTKNLTYYFYPIQENDAKNAYIDTAYFLSPALDTRQPNELVVNIKNSGKVDDQEMNLQIIIDNQVRGVSTFNFKGDTSYIDTLKLQLAGNGWQKISVAIQDHPLTFDDTFRIAARTSPNLSILTLNDGIPNAYIQTALGNQAGFTLQQESVNNIHSENWKKYSLIILQNISSFSPQLTTAIQAALANGQNIVLFPGNIQNINAFNQSLHQIGDITFGTIDTTQQPIATLQSAHPLLQDVFAKVQDNVQLPVSLRRYPIDASLTANQQSLMSFKDGKPFLAQYAIAQGKFYICASPLNDQSSNFPLSYYFVPILYKMAVQAGSNSIYAINVGSNQPVWIPSAQTENRNIWKLTKGTLVTIPSQRPSANGVDIFTNKSIDDAGFYNLFSNTSTDTTVLAFNTNRQESKMEFATKSNIDQLLSPQKVTWIDNSTVANYGWEKAKAPFPIWKICIILALIALIIETYLLLTKRSVQATLLKE